MDKNNKNNTIDEIIHIPVLNPGDKLYHYTSAAGMKGICEGEFWVTERNFLNDSMEFHVATDVIFEILEKYMKKKRKFKKLKEKICSEINIIQETSFGPPEKGAYCGDYVISFCKDDDSPLMWSSYSDYIGYCIQFDFDKFINSFPENYIHQCLHGTVVYDHTQQVKYMKESIEQFLFDSSNEFEYLLSWDDFDNMTDDNINEIAFHIAVVVSVYNMFFKLPCFEGEHEYRFVFMSAHYGGHYKEKDLTEQRFRIKDEVLIPYIVVPINSIDAIEKILIGIKNKSDVAEKGIKYFFRKHRCSINVEKSQIPLRY